MTLRAWFSAGSSPRRSESRRARRRNALLTVDALEPRRLLADFGTDAALIDANSTIGVGAYALRWTYLVTDGAATNPPWEQLRPNDLSTYSDPATTTTSTTNGITISTTEAKSATGVMSGTPYRTAWSINYTYQDDSTTTITSPDGTSVETIVKHYDLTWQGSGSGGGPATTYSVQQNASTSDSSAVTDPTSPSYARSQSQSYDEHLTVSGGVDSGGTVSGTFTDTGDTAATFSLHDASGLDANGTALATGAGYTVDYSASSAETYSGSGSLSPGASSQATVNLTSSENGTLGAWDGNGGVSGASRKDADQVQGVLDASKGKPATATGTTGTVDATGPTTTLTIPIGKHRVDVVDVNDKGWASWDAAARKNYIEKYNLKNTSDTSPIADGSDFLKALGQSYGSFIPGDGVNQIIRDLRTEVGQNGWIDVLLIADHGNRVDGQQFGEGYLTATGDDAAKANLNSVVGFISPGGTLVLTGCSVFKNQTQVNDWQAYATEKNITIIGSASTNTTGPGGWTGVWITLVPGGTAPTIINGSPPGK